MYPSFDYVRLYLFVQVYFLQQKKTDEHLAQLRRWHQGFKVQQLQEGPPDKGYSSSPAGVHNLLHDPEYPPLAQGESDSPPASPDEELEINVLGKRSRRLDPPIVSVASRDTRWRLSTTSIPTCDLPQEPQEGSKGGTPLQGLWQHLAHP